MSRGYANGYSDAVSASVKASVYETYTSAPDGLTADEAAERMGLTVLAVRPEVCHLHKEGRLHKAGFKRKNASGLFANVWVTS